MEEVKSYLKGICNGDFFTGCKCKNVVPIKKGDISFHICSGNQTAIKGSKDTVFIQFKNCIRLVCFKDDIKGVKVEDRLMKVAFVNGMEETFTFGTNHFESLGTPAKTSDQEASD